MMFRHRTMVPAACVCALVLSACGGEEKKPVRAPEPPPAAPAKTSEATVTSAPITKPVSPTVSVTEDIAKACKLNLGDIARAPKFEFDRSELLPADHDVLSEIGKCVMDGPLKGRSLQLVGRADPRGTNEYNMALGSRRAHSVVSFLQQYGVDPTRMKETSRGELDATGTDEATWQIDRRVDILLIE